MSKLSHNIHADILSAAGLDAQAGIRSSIKTKNVYRFECLRPDGSVRWVEEVPNTTTTEGVNDLLTQYFKGVAYTAACFVGLVDNAGFTAFAIGDTAAQIGGTNGWAEATYYSNGTRPALTLGSAAAGSIDNSASKAVFNINGSGTVKGAFVDTVSTKSGTTGKLYGEAAFGTARAVLSGDTLSVTCTLTAS
jgi:hypothetical protein